VRSNNKAKENFLRICAVVNQRKNYQVYLDMS